MAPMVKDYTTPQLVERTIEVSQKFLEYVISGEMPSFETPDDSQDDSQDLLDHEV